MHDGEDLHILDVRTTKLQQALETDTYIFLKKNMNAPRPSEHPPVRGENIHENNNQAYVALFKSVISMKYFRIQCT